MKVYRIYNKKVGQYFRTWKRKTVWESLKSCRQARTCNTSGSEDFEIHEFELTEPTILEN